MIDVLIRAGLAALTLITFVATLMDNGKSPLFSHVVLAVFCVSGLLSIIFFDGVSDE